MKHNFSTKIRKVRILKGFTQEYIANRLGISQRGYSKLENNEIKLDWSRLTEISAILEIDPLELIRFDENIVFQNSPNQDTHPTKNSITKELKNQYEKQITHLEEEIRFLRSQLKDRDDRA